MTASIILGVDASPVFGSATHVRNGMLSPVDFERKQRMSTEGV
jgi:hypothetical protein